jgi:hypothetical protein
MVRDESSWDTQIYVIESVYINLSIPALLGGPVTFFGIDQDKSKLSLLVVAAVLERE